MNSQVPNTHVHLQISILSLITGFSYFSLKKKFFTTKKFDLKISDILKSRIVLEISKMVVENPKLRKV